MIAQSDFLLSEKEFQLVRDVVYKHCGISLSDEKHELVRARLAKQLRAGGFPSVNAYLTYALKDRSGNAFKGFIDSISTNLTSFFREKQHFDYLTDTFLPSLLLKKRQQGDGRLMAWSAACSSGEEAYSLAITMLKAVEQPQASSARWDIRLLATDISTAMVATATGGLYSPERLLSIPDASRERYFGPPSLVDGTVKREVSPDLRKLIRFRHLNLMDAWPFAGPFDFIFCRNVMIYFDKATQQRLVDRFWNCLSPGGLLFTGHSESLTGITHRLTHLRASIYQKREL